MLQTKTPFQISWSEICCFLSSILVKAGVILDVFLFCFGPFLYFSPSSLRASDDRLGWHRWQNRAEIKFPGVFGFLCLVSIGAGHGLFWGDSLYFPITCFVGCI